MTGIILTRRILPPPHFVKFFCEERSRSSRGNALFFSAAFGAPHPRLPIFSSRASRRRSGSSKNFRKRYAVRTFPATSGSAAGHASANVRPLPKIHA